jgi:hypothetical protein
MSNLELHPETIDAPDAALRPELGRLVPQATACPSREEK